MNGKIRGRLLVIDQSQIKANPTVPFMSLSSPTKVHVVYGLATTGDDFVSIEEVSDLFLSPQGSSCDINTIALGLKAPTPGLKAPTLGLKAPSGPPRSTPESTQPLPAHSFMECVTSVLLSKRPTAPSLQDFQFDISLAAAQHNCSTFAAHDRSLENVIASDPNSIMAYGSDFKPPEILAPLLQSHLGGRTSIEFSNTGRIT